MPPALTLAPHRALFTTGALATLLPMLWWLLELLGRASGMPLLDHPVPAMLAHAPLPPWPPPGCWAIWPPWPGWCTTGYGFTKAARVYLPPACWDCAGYGWGGSGKAASQTA